MTTQQTATLDLLTETVEACVQELMEPLQRLHREMHEMVDVAFADALRRVERPFRGRADASRTDDLNGHPHAAADLNRDRAYAG